MYIYIYIYIHVYIYIYIHVMMFYIISSIVVIINAIVVLHLSHGDLTSTSPTRMSEVTLCALNNNNMYCQRGDNQGCVALQWVCEL